MTSPSTSSRVGVEREIEGLPGIQHHRLTPTLPLSPEMIFDEIRGFLHRRQQEMQEEALASEAAAAAVAAAGRHH